MSVFENCVALFVRPHILHDGYGVENNDKVIAATEAINGSPGNFDAALVVVGIFELKPVRVLPTLVWHKSMQGDLRRRTERRSRGDRRDGLVGASISIVAILRYHVVAASLYEAATMSSPLIK